MKTLKAFPVSVFLIISLFLIPIKLFSQPTMTQIITDDTNSNGHIDRLSIYFSETVDITGPASGLDCFDITPPLTYTIDNNDYTGTVTFLTPLEVGLIEIGPYDTGEEPTLTYRQGRANQISGGSGEIEEGHSLQATDGAKPIIVISKTYDNNSDGLIDRVEFELSEPIVDVPGTDNFDIAGYVGESFSTTVTGINGGVDDNDADDDRFSIGFTQGGGYDTGSTPNFDYTADGTDDVEDTSGNGNKLASIVGGTTSDGANPVLVAVEVTRYNISGTDWWNRVNLTYSETVSCGDLAPGGGLAASDATAGDFNPSSEHGGDYSNGSLAGYGSFASGGNVTVSSGEVGVTVEAGGTVRFDLARSDDGHGSISGGNTAPSGDFTPPSNTGIRDAEGNHLVSTAAVSPTAGTLWDLVKPSISVSATYDANRDGSIDCIEFEISDAGSSGIQDGFDAANFNISGYGGEGFSTQVTGISGGLADADANDNRFSITFTQAGPWDTDATPGYTYTGSDVYCVDLAGNRLDNTGQTAIDGAPPAFRSIVTRDNDENGHIDRLELRFSEQADITDAGGGGDGLDCISVSGYSISGSDYGGVDVDNVTLILNEGGGYDTGAVPSLSYTTLGGSTIIDRADVPNEMVNGETASTADGAGPIMLSALFYDPDSNDIDVGDYIQVGFTEAVQLSCTSSSDFELLNSAFGDTFGVGSILDDPTPADAYINIVLGTGPSLILPDLWSVPGAGNPSGLGIKAGGTFCVEDPSSNGSPEGMEVDIGGAGSNIIIRVTATDGSSVFVNPYLSAALMDSDITIEIESQFNASFVALWYDVGAQPDGLCVTNPDDRRVVATGSGKNWTAIISGDDPELIEGAVVRFIIDTDGAVYYYDGPEASGGSVPWDFRIFYEQAERVTIRNNIINPHHGDVVYFNYYLGTQKSVAVTVYDLAGNPVIQLASGTGAVGPNLTTWDGKNRRGAIVVPGVYYVVIKLGNSRYVRKVLVVR
jgi:hypothetical protein